MTFAPQADVPGREIWHRDVVIIVLNWNRREATLECLESLMKADLRGACVAVVDNGSTDGSVEAIQTRFPSVKVIALPENRGYAGGNNEGIYAALYGGAKAVVVLNNDTIVAPDFLLFLLWSANAERARRRGVEHRTAHRLPRAARRRLSLDLLRARHRLAPRGERAAKRGFRRAAGDRCRHRLCDALFCADALQTVGVFDEAYFAYHEEVDWCFRARQAGYRIMYQPLSRVWHHGSKSTDRPRPPKPRLIANEAQLPNPVPLSWSPVRAYLGARNSVRFVRQHATRKQTRYFIRSSLYKVPLEFLAAVHGP